MTLTKNDLVENLLLHHNFSRMDSFKIIDTIIEIMKNTLESGEKVVISGFGKFSIQNKKERRGRNPSNGETMMLGARKIITFNCSKKLRTKINQ